MFYSLNLLKYILVFFLFFPSVSKAEFDWISFTYDNDFFLGDDSGYTNGLFFSLYELENSDKKIEPSWMLSPLKWSIESESALSKINSYTVGQVIITPDDITQKVPPSNSTPYAGMLFLNDTYISSNKKYADAIRVTLGVVGPISGAEHVQKEIHRIVGANDPKGWDTQLNNELVFQFSRARAWRSWVSENQRFDIVNMLDVSLGTISSSVSASSMIRYGKNLEKSYETILYAQKRTSNPVSVKKEHWNVFASIYTKYLFNSIFLDGNTFEKSRSVDYDPKHLGMALGFSYSWNNYIVSLAINNFNQGDKERKNLDRFGTFTIAIKL